jgi:hypothetical protein
MAERACVQRELGQAPGAFGKGAAGANLTLTAGRSLEQVGMRIPGGVSMVDTVQHAYKELGAILLLYQNIMCVGEGGVSAQNGAVRCVSFLF